MMQVIHFLFPKPIRKDADRMLRGLPKSMLPILPRMLLEYFDIHFWQMTRRIFNQFATRELAHVVQRVLQSFNLGGVKDPRRAEDQI